MPHYTDSDAFRQLLLDAAVLDVRLALLLADGARYLRRLDGVEGPEIRESRIDRESEGDRDAERLPGARRLRRR